MTTTAATAEVPSGLRCLLLVEAENDHTLAARVLQLFTIRGANPERFSLEKIPGDRLRIRVELAGFDDDRARQLVKQIERLPTVIEVGRFVHYRRGG
jgi:acetolactate synthase small subunit